MLIMADNARDAEQMRALLPGASGCFVLVTSRGALTGLAATNGACILHPDVPDEAEAAELLGRRLGEQAPAEPATVAAVVNSILDDALPAQSADQGAQIGAAVGRHLGAHHLRP